MSHSLGSFRSQDARRNRRLAPRSASLGIVAARSTLGQSRKRTPPVVKSILVIPCYNEALRLDVQRIRGFLDRNPAWDLRFVDDGSTDSTPLILDELRRAYPDRVFVQRMAANGGKAEAVRSGFIAALDALPAPGHVGYLDADFSTPPESLLPFRELLEKRSDLQGVIGVRLPLGGRRIKRELHKSFFNQTFSLLASAVLGTRFRDPTCGAKLLRASPELRSALHRPFATRGIFDVELIARLGAYGDRAGLGPVEWSIYEYPLEVWNDVGGSHRKLDDYWDAFWDLGRVLWDHTWYGLGGRRSRNLAEGEQRIDEQANAETADIDASDSLERPFVARHGDADAAERYTATELNAAIQDDGDETLSRGDFAQALDELDGDHESAQLDAMLASTDELEMGTLEESALDDDLTDDSTIGEDGANDMEFDAGLEPTAEVEYPDFEDTDGDHETRNPTRGYGNSNHGMDRRHKKKKRR